MAGDGGNNNASLLRDSENETKGDLNDVTLHSFRPSFHAEMSGHTIMVKRCTSSLWVMGILGAYCFWNGYASPSLNDEGDISLPATILGAIGLILFVGSVAWLAKYGEMELEKQPITTFRAYGVPFVPSFAILCNFFLMAQYDVWTHAYLGFFIVASLIGYVAYRFTRP